MSYSYREKWEAVEFLIKARRDAGLRQDALSLILKSIASDYRNRDPIKISKAIQQIGDAIDETNRDRLPTTEYVPGKLRLIGELTIGAWPAIKQAMEEFRR